MSETTTRTRTAKVTVTDEMLKSYREIGNESPSPMALLLRTLSDAEAKKQIQRVENAVEKSSKSRLDEDAEYQREKKNYENCKNTFYRTRNKLNVVDVKVPNPIFDAEQDTSDENPETIIVQRDGFQTRIASLFQKIAEVETERNEAAGKVATGEKFDAEQDESPTNLPEGVLHENMRLAQGRKRALARKVMGLNGTDKDTPNEILTDGES